MRVLYAALGAGLMLCPAMASALPAKVGSTPQGEVLQTPEGQSLYVYDKDKVGTGISSCDDTCAKNWPPFKVAGSEKPEGEWSIIKLPDGSKQWAYKGRPLYTFVKDTGAGQVNGKSYEGNSWHQAAP